MLCRTRWSCFTTLLLSCALAAQSQHTTKPNFTQDDTVERQDFPTASVSCATTNFLLHSFDVRNLNESLGQVAHTTEPVRVVNFCVSFLEKVRLSPPDQSMKQDHRPRHTAEMERQLRQHVFPNCSTTTQQPSANGLSVTVTYPGSGRHADLFTPYATVPPNCVDRISNFRMSQQGLFLVSVVQRVSLEANEFADLSCNVSTPKGVSWTQRMPEAHESNRSVAWFLQNCSDTAAVDSHANMSEGSALCPPILLTQLHSSATTLSKAAERWQHVYDFRQAQKSEQKVLKKQRRRLLSARSSAQQVKARDGLENGTALKNIYTDEVHEAALGLHQHFGFTSFLSEGDTVAGSDAIKMILDPVIHGVMNPVIQIVVGEISDRFMEVMGDQLREILEQNVPPNAALMLASTMIPSVTNALLDSVTARLSRSLSESLAVDLGTSLEVSVSNSLIGSLRRSLSETLSYAIPARLRMTLPKLVSGPLMYSMVSTLTKSVTHALVPTLTSVLTSERHQSMACSNCFYHQKHCNLCRFSPGNQYYDNYYATYYSDYYSNYYGHYFDTALEGMLVNQAAASKKARDDYVAEIKRRHGT